jgi:hypothetical protein
MLKHLLSKGGHTPGRIFSNPFPHSRVVTRDEYVIQEVVEEPRIHEHISQEEDLEDCSSNSFQHIEEIKESWTTSDEE